MSKEVSIENVKPSDIGIPENFNGTFGKRETEQVARKIVLFAQKLDKWIAFSWDEYRYHSPTHDNERGELTWLAANGYLTWPEGKYQVTDKFIHAIFRFINPDVLDAIYGRDVVATKNKDSKEMPKYKCHKVVGALQIKEVRPYSIKQLSGIYEKGFFLDVVEPGYEPIKVSQDFIVKHNPQVGNYYVVYEDGYKSISPAKAFEAGYTKIDANASDCPNKAKEHVEHKPDRHNESKKENLVVIDSDDRLMTQKEVGEMLDLDLEKPKLEAPANAVQLTWDTWDEMCEFIGVGELTDGRPEGRQDGDKIGMDIPTTEGLIHVSENDWIVKSLDGEFYLCKGEAFALPELANKK